eukprot:TRINITY_DN14785_c0_g1_i1.p1 TRINITY_DN14785_c0_g1~~TRINITY_DN14785_c0_g1_i1.p1  ORF type:complete len:285 (+),score=27.78 TRINITY_DN14785_c0_g1_i1:89-943(+)
MTRQCMSCHAERSRSSYSRNQWLKGDERSRCVDCVDGNTSTVQRLTARRNRSSRCTYTPEPFAEGAFRYVCRGIYQEGERKGEECVAKYFKTNAQVYEASYFDADIKVVDKTLDILSKFNAGPFLKKHIMLNQPEVWTQEEEGYKLLVEPYISNWEKFNSNSGWANSDTPWPQVMQAVSHYSYHITKGDVVLCDLQGGIYSNGVVLTDPVILSRSKAYGPTDLGSEGISTFFARHQCNGYCKKHWMKPRDQTVYYEEREGTSMMAVPTRQSREQMSLPRYGRVY